MKTFTKKLRSLPDRSAPIVFCSGLMAVVLSIVATAHAANELPENITDLQWAPESLFNPNLYMSQPAGNENNLEKTVQNIWKLSAEKTGFTPFVSYYGDFLANPVGGYSQTRTWYQLLQFGGELSCDRYGWKGGSIFVSGSDATGQDLSSSIGNFFTAAQTVGMNTIALNNSYLKQKFGDNDWLELRVGRMAPGLTFAMLPIEGLAVSSAANGNPASLGGNTSFRNKSSGTSWAAYACLKTATNFSTQAGIYQADPRGGLASYHGLDFSIRPGDGTLMFLETDWTPTFGLTKDSTSKDGKSVTPGSPGLPGVYQFGGYYSNYTFQGFLGGNQYNAFGFYLQGQQMVWRKPRNPDFNLTLWGGVTYSPQSQIAIMPVMGFGGVDLQGLIPGRNKDSLFMNFYVGGFSPEYSTTSIQAGTGASTAESVLELGYIVQLTKNLQFQPDVQYIMRPMGTGSIPNALVVGFQVAALF